MGAAEAGCVRPLAGAEVKAAQPPRPPPPLGLLGATTRATTGTAHPEHAFGDGVVADLAVVRLIRCTGCGEGCGANVGG